MMDPARTRAIERYYAVPEVALLLSFSTKWVRSLIRSGTFPNAVDLAGDLRIPASDINAYLDAHRVQITPVGIAANSIGELRRKVA